MPLASFRTKTENDFDWDYDLHMYGPMRMTIYTPEYDLARVKRHRVSISHMPYLIESIKGWRRSFNKHNQQKQQDLVGIDSDSLNDNRHCLFMEWDDKKSVDLEKLRKEEGIISETDKGYHFLKMASLNVSELIKEQAKWNCCEGFIKYTKLRGYSTLRICEKGENKVRMRKYSDGLLYEIYRNLITKLGGKDESDSKERY